MTHLTHETTPISGSTVFQNMLDDIVTVLVLPLKKSRDGRELVEYPSKMTIRGNYSVHDPICKKMKPIYENATSDVKLPKKNLIL